MQHTTLAQASSGLDPAAEFAVLHQALALRRGGVLEGLTIPGASNIIAHVDEVIRSTSHRYARAAKSGGDPAAASSVLDQLVACYPLDETLHAGAIEVLAAAGRPAEAIWRFEQLRARLADELGVDPSPAVRSAYLRVLRQQLPAPSDSITDVHSEQSAGIPSRPTPAQLPPDVASFAGRDEHLRQLTALLADGGQPRSTAVAIVAITGMAGIGKTALAVHWAHRDKDQFPDGQLYANLRGFDPGGSMVGPAEALRGFLDALGVPPKDIPHDLAARVSLYRSLVAGSRILIVLDDARDAEQVRPLLPGSPSCLVLVTSRDDLTGLVAVESARPLTLDLLTADEAHTLLARRLGPDRLAGQPEAVAEIIVRCGRLPLALAVVAARAANRPAFPLSTLARELGGSSLDALADPDPASDVRTVFAWSYRHLRADAARLFRLLALHPGPDITAPAATSLAGGAPSQVRSWLGELTRAHLIAEHRPGRFAFHDLVRAYAIELAHAQDSGVQRRAAVNCAIDHYLQTALAAARVLNPNRNLVMPPAPEPGVTLERLTSYDEELAWFTAEHEVLLRCVNHAATHGSDTQTWQLACAVANFLGRRGHWHDQVAVSQTALAAAQRGDDRTGQAVAHRSLGIACARIERYAEAEFHLQRTLELWVELGDRVNQAHTHINLSSMLGFQRRHREALEHDLRALEIARAIDDQLGQARALNAVGWDFATLGDHEQAIHHCEQALALLQAQGDRRAQAGAWDSLGYSHHHLGHYTYALTCHHNAIAMFRETGDRYYEASTLTHLMDTLEVTRDIDGAQEAGRQALTILEDLGHSEAAAVRARLHRLRTLKCTSSGHSSTLDAG